MYGRAGEPRLVEMESTDRPVLRSRAWLIAAAVLTGVVLALATVGASKPYVALAAVAGQAALAVGIVAWALVRSRQQRRSYENELTAWVAERATHAERLRIARDLHDLASHGLGLITVRAAAARTRTGPDGDAERARALADIEQAGRQATTELRRMLTVLRTPIDAAASLRPPETLDDLPGIVDAARTGGVDATLQTRELGRVSPGVQLTACAIVREALANTARHAGPTRARVTIRRDADGVLVTVEDDGPRPGWRPHPGAGQGLAGLRERVVALAGTLDARPYGHGFRLTARLPDQDNR